MFFYWLIPFFAIVVLTTSNGAIIASEKKNRTKYSLLIFNSSLVLWACLDLMIWVHHFDNDTGRVFTKIMSVSWLSIGFLFLNFVYALLNKKADAVFYSAIVVSVLMMLVSLFTNKIVAGVENYYWGMFPTFGDWILPAVAFVLWPIIYGLSLIAKAYKSENNSRVRKIYSGIIIASLVTTAIDTTVDVVLPVVFHVKIISMATLSNSLLSAVFLFIINKYRFLELSLEEFSKNIFDKVTEGVIITNDNSEIVMLNQAATELIAKNESDIQKIIALKDPGNSVIKSKLKDALTGASTYLNVSNNSLEAGDGRELRLFLLNDVSELVKYRNSLQDKNDEMQITLYRISHDIKGPAAAIKQLVLFSKTDKDNAELYLSKIEVSINQLIHFLGEVETLIRIKESVPVREQIDLKSIINRCWSELEFFKKNEKHKLILNINDSVFVSDPLLIYTIVLNIMSNAIKYNDIKNKGENCITISTVVTNGDIDISISDNGEGMDETVLSNMYKLFFRGNASVNGTGLGMYLVKQAVKKLNGKIQIHSKPNTGTRFTVQLPKQ